MQATPFLFARLIAERPRELSQDRNFQFLSELYKFYIQKYSIIENISAIQQTVCTLFLPIFTNASTLLPGLAPGLGELTNLDSL